MNRVALFYHAPTAPGHTFGATPENTHAAIVGSNRLKTALSFTEVSERGELSTGAAA